MSNADCALVPIAATSTDPGHLLRSVDAKGPVLPSLISAAYTSGILTGALLADDDAVQESAEAVRIAEERGDDVALEVAHFAQGLVLSRRATAAERAVALVLLRRARDALVRQRMLAQATMADVRIVELTAEGGEVQGAIESGRSIVDQLFESGEMLTRGVATAALVRAAATSGIGHRQAGSGGCNRTVGRRANRPRICPERNPCDSCHRLAERLRLGCGRRGALRCQGCSRRRHRCRRRRWCRALVTRGQFSGVADNQCSASRTGLFACEADAMSEARWSSWTSWTPSWGFRTRDMNVVADPERIKTDRDLIPLAQRRDLGRWEFVDDDYPSVSSGVLRELLDQAETWPPDTT